MKISKFYQDDYSASALYQSARTLASYIDGNKFGARKILHVIDKNNITAEIKSSSLAAKVVESEAYLHGQVSLEGTIVTLAQNFVGTNNYNLLKPDGNFGNRFIHEASASRYIFTRKSEWFDKFFIKDDYPVLVEQSFEGDRIEPRFYVPVLPLILLNGSEGVGNGFAQKILPRRLEDVVDAIKKILEGKKVKRLTPWVKGYGGSINLLDDNKVEVHGMIELKNTTTILITEIPFQYDLDGYLKVLNTLMDKKVIKDYNDKSDNGKFLFEVFVTREFTKDRDAYDIKDDLKLIKRMTENFTCIDENNAIIEFADELELLKKYIEVRTEYYKKRKKYKLGIMEEDISILKNQVRFITGIVTDDLEVNNQSKAQIIHTLELRKFDKVEDSFDYLLRMPIWSLTQEKIVELKEKYKTLESKALELKIKTPEILWKEDLTKI
jgi:DNA topoisomerase-2